VSSTGTLAPCRLQGPGDPNVFDSCPVYQSAPSGASAGSWGYGSWAHSLMAIFADEASLPASIAACLAAKPATWRLGLNSAPKNTSRAATKIPVTVRRLEKLGSCVHALFFEVMAEKADQPCSTFLLRQCGQTMFSFSCSATVKLFENVFLQA